MRVARTYTIHEAYIGLLDHLARHTGKSRSALIEEALSLTYQADLGVPPGHREKSGPKPRQKETTKGAS
tara:strand:+ start:774 stop:980 length:207 start_codon:yes stop_codon:yes gene_type:complete